MERRSRIKPWMLLYTCVFGVLSVFFFADDLKRHYVTLYLIWAFLLYLAISAGNFSYSLDWMPVLRPAWKLVFPLVCLQFIVSGVLDETNMHEDPLTASSLSTWFIGFLLFLPTFVAHYRIAYGKA